MATTVPATAEIDLVVPAELVLVTAIDPAAAVVLAAAVVGPRSNGRAEAETEAAGTEGVAAGTGDVRTYRASNQT